MITSLKVNNCALPGNRLGSAPKPRRSLLIIIVDIVLRPWRVCEVPAQSVASGRPTAAQPLAGLLPGARNGVRFNVNGRSWVGVDTEDYSSSTVFDVSTTGDTKAGPSFQGSLGRLIAIE